MPTYILGQIFLFLLDFLCPIFAEMPLSERVGGFDFAVRFGFGNRNQLHIFWNFR